MKSVLKTFSQTTGNILAKSCLAVLCVFVFSSMGNAQSFMEATDAQQVLRPLMQDMKSADLVSMDVTKVKLTADNGVMVQQTIASDEVGEMSIRSVYYSSLSEYIDWTNYPNVVSNAIERNHQKMVGRFNASDAFLELLKLEVTELLTN